MREVLYERGVVIQTKSVTLAVRIFASRCQTEEAPLFSSLYHQEVFFMFKNLCESAKSLKSTYTICVCSIMVAAYVVLDMFQLQLAPQIVVSFSYIPIAIAGWMFGIVPAMIVGGVSDIMSFLIKPTGAFFPGFTITAILTGFVFGAVLYKSKGKFIWINSILSKTLITILLNIGLNTLWTSMLTGKAYMVLLYGRIIKNAFMLVPEILTLALLIVLLSKRRILNK